MIGPVERSPSLPVGPQGISDDSVIVQQGETFAQIAQKNNVTESELKEANPEVDPSRIQAGLELALPQKKQEPQAQSRASQQLSSPPPASNSAGRVAEHALGGSVRAAWLHSQLPATTLKERTLEGKITQPAPGDPKTQTKPPDTTVQTVLTNAGVKNVSNPPSDADLKTYYSRTGPAHDLIAKENYKDAAAEYRKIASTQTDPKEKARLESVAKQLDVAGTIKDAQIGSVAFPPSEANVASYFKTLKGKPLADIQSAFQDYTNAFYVHSETPGVDRGDVQYSLHQHVSGNTLFNSHAPETWQEVSDKRDLHSDSRRVIDCEGYALMGQKAFAAAGFTNIKFAVAAREDNPNTPEDESLTRQHIMVSGTRTVEVDGKKQTEIAVISNNHFNSDRFTPTLKTAEQENNLRQVFVNSYGDTFREFPGKKVVIPGGVLVFGDQAWRTGFELEDAIKALKQQKKQPAQ